jgi:RNA polymerase sigma factor (sigma-70 family)
MRRERIGHTLPPTAVVNESLIRLADTASRERFQDRRQLIAAATVAIKRVLIDYARARATYKRGGDRKRVPLDDAQGDAAVQDQGTDRPWVGGDDPLAEDENVVGRLLRWYDEQGLDVIALDEALDELRDMEPRWVEVILLRFFGGYTIEQASELLEVSPRTVAEDWNRARAWLRVRLEDRHGRSDGTSAADDEPLRGCEPSAGS